jgi:hypothetical protein
VSDRDLRLDRTRAHPSFVRHRPGRGATNGKIGLKAPWPLSSSTSVLLSSAERRHWSAIIADDKKQLSVARNFRHDVVLRVVRPSVLPSYSRLVVVFILQKMRASNIQLTAFSLRVVRPPLTDRRHRPRRLRSLIVHHPPGDVRLRHTLVRMCAVDEAVCLRLSVCV